MYFRDMTSSYIMPNKVSLIFPAFRNEVNAKPKKVSVGLPVADGFFAFTLQDLQKLLCSKPTTIDNVLFFSLS